jgi:hypothetical protein
MIISTQTAITLFPEIEVITFKNTQSVLDKMNECTSQIFLPILMRKIQDYIDLNKNSNPKIFLASTTVTNQQTVTSSTSPSLPKYKSISQMSLQDHLEIRKKLGIKGDKEFFCHICQAYIHKTKECKRIKEAKFANLDLSDMKKFTKELSMIIPDRWLNTNMLRDKSPKRLQTRCINNIICVEMNQIQIPLTIIQAYHKEPKTCAISMQNNMKQYSCPYGGDTKRFAHCTKCQMHHSNSKCYEWTHVYRDFLTNNTLQHSKPTDYGLNLPQFEKEYTKFKPYNNNNNNNSNNTNNNNNTSKNKKCVTCNGVNSLTWNQASCQWCTWLRTSNKCTFSCGQNHPTDMNCDGDPLSRSEKAMLAIITDLKEKVPKKKAKQTSKELKPTITSEVDSEYFTDCEDDKSDVEQ